MAVSKRIVEVATCDSCGKVTAAKGDGVRPIGIYGKVAAVMKDGTSVPVDFYACKMPHVGKAVKAVLDVAELSDGESEHQADGDQADGDTSPDVK